MENSGIVIATLHSLDVEYAAMLAKMAEKLGRNLYSTSSEAITSLERTPEISVKPHPIEEYVKAIPVEEPTPLRPVEPNSVILTSHRNVIDMVREADADALGDTVVVISEPEPASEEMTEYNVVANWMARLNVQSYKDQSFRTLPPIPAEENN